MMRSITNASKPSAVFLDRPPQCKVVNDTVHHRLQDQGLMPPNEFDVRTFTVSSSDKPASEKCSIKLEGQPSCSRAGVGWKRIDHLVRIISGMQVKTDEQKLIYRKLTKDSKSKEIARRGLPITIHLEEGSVKLH